MVETRAQPIATTEHIPASEHGRTFPPFDAQTFASQLIWLAVTFVALYLLMSRVALPRIGSILTERRRHIDDDLAQVQHLESLSSAALAAHEKALNEARSRAQTLANQTRAKASAAAEARRKEVDAQLNAHIGEAEKAIAAKRAEAMHNVRAIAGDAAGAIVERLIGAAPPRDEVARAVDTVTKR
jgi:F-type H+-transporting ATPase subunit b